MSLNLPLSTIFIGIYIVGDFYQLQNLLTGKMVPILYPTLGDALDAQRSMDWYNSPDWWDKTPSTGEDDIASALAAEIAAWDEVIARVTVNV